VALSVLMVAIAAPMTLVQNSLSSANFATKQITASFLAQDALEYVQSVRDSSVGTNDWLGGFVGICQSPNGCTIDTAVDAVSACSSTCPKLNYLPSFGVYAHFGGGSGAVESPFRRKVVVESINSQEASVTSTVSWTGTLGDRSVVLKKRLFEWQQ